MQNKYLWINIFKEFYYFFLEMENCSYWKLVGCYYFDVNGKVLVSDV